jgi:hypothetical protein
MVYVNFFPGPNGELMGRANFRNGHLKKLEVLLGIAGFYDLLIDVVLLKLPENSDATRPASTTV